MMIQQIEFITLLKTKWRSVNLKKIGYTSGVFDLFHIGHLNILRESKKNCDYLIVGVTTDEQVKKIKGFYPIIPFEERLEIVSQIKYVDEVFIEEDTNKVEAWNKLKFNILFKGDDWKDSFEYIRYQEFFEKKDVKVIFFPYTRETSSTQLRKIINLQLKEGNNE